MVLGAQLQLDINEYMHSNINMSDLLRGGISKSNVKLKGNPFPSTPVTSTVCLVEPNLSDLSTRGNVQFSAGPPSNEQVIDCTGCVTPQLNTA